MVLKAMIKEYGHVATKAFSRNINTVSKNVDGAAFALFFKNADNMAQSGKHLSKGVAIVSGGSDDALKVALKQIPDYMDDVTKLKYLEWIGKVAVKESDSYAKSLIGNLNKGISLISDGSDDALKAVMKEMPETLDDITKLKYISGLGEIAIKKGDLYAKDLRIIIKEATDFFGDEVGENAVKLVKSDNLDKLLTQLLDAGQESNIRGNLYSLSKGAEFADVGIRVDFEVPNPTGNRKVIDILLPDEGIYLEAKTVMDVPRWTNIKRHLKKATGQLHGIKKEGGATEIHIKILGESSLTREGIISKLDDWIINSDLIPGNQLDKIIIEGMGEPIIKVI